MELLLDLVLQHRVSGLAIAVLCLLFICSILRTKRDEKIPLINPPKWFEPTSTRVKLAFALNARKWLTKGVETGKPFRLMTDIGELTVLPSKFARELRADTRLDFAAVINRTFHAKFPGFEGFREGTPDAHRTRDVVRRHLTNCPDEVTASVSEECLAALQDVLTESTDWHEINLREHVLQVVARMSSHVFLGSEGARNKAWLKITMDYTTNAYIAAMLLRLWPEALRPFVHWVMPQCRTLRKQVAEARQIVTNIIDRRRQQKAAAEAENRPQPVFNDVIEWFAQDEKEEGSDYDPVVGQLILMQAAIHTTTDLLTQAMLDIALNPDISDPLRREVAESVRQNGWSKSSLAEMHLVDAAVKESQRLKPIARSKDPPFLRGCIETTDPIPPLPASMHRLVLDDVQLSDGTLVPKHAIIGISVDQMWSANLYENPDVWNPHRFLRTSRTGAAAAAADSKDASLTSSSPEHLAWGYGKHACAGRFFVAQEVKVALSHLLLHYEWKLAPSSGKTKPLEIGLTLAADPMAKVMVRKNPRVC
ncbi:Cytochrome P450 monooygenase 1 [Colletotrichum spinosum]|uniref:Cytochrome P450 monooygenase 1 n=1 Tax=Colletotrichum spinosum TaxID=1347390 RepID=A0A4R8PN49_9PEZI|nr:Cytochrome P450 monooygenase 1 [Colletotrichum spinosum]